MAGPPSPAPGRSRPGRLASRLDRDDPRGLRRTLAWLGLLLVALPFSLLLISVVTDGPLLSWDQPVADELNEWAHRSELRVDAFQAVSWFGWPPVLAAWVVLIAVACWTTARRRLAWFLVVTTATGAVAQVGLKAVVARPRPEVLLPVATARGDSFPSGHAMASTIVYGAILLVVLPRLPRRARVPVVVGTVVLVLAIGVSRLVLGVHFVTDVVGGHVAGLAWLVGAAAVFEVWRLHEGPTPQDDELAGPAPDGTAPDGTTPEGTTPEGTTPEGTTPEGTTPDGTTTDRRRLPPGGAASTTSSDVRC